MFLLGLVALHYLFLWVKHRWLATVDEEEDDDEEDDERWRYRYASRVEAPAAVSTDVEDESGDSINK